MSGTMTVPAFVAHLAHLLGQAANTTHHALDQAAAIVEAEAKAELGTYQGAAPPFGPWPELADRTKADRLQQGFSPSYARHGRDSLAGVA
jgi:hypothetical protein